ncbi:MAG: hypothetical protein KDA81_16525, partial [Planctomycetaceae bacterium]|nr:hypothetical protein [Planctomycetaceae bacterium]
MRTHKRTQTTAHQHRQYRDADKAAFPKSGLCNSLKHPNGFPAGLILSVSSTQRLTRAVPNAVTRFSFNPNTVQR